MAAAPPIEGAAPQIGPAQIALAVLGVVVLLAVGVGAALLLLDEDDEVADTSLPAESEPDTPFGQLTPAPAPPPAASAPDPAPPPPTEQLPQGQLEPVPAPDAGPAPGEDPSGEGPSGEGPSGEDPSGEQPGSAAPPGAPQPEIAPPPGGDPSDGEVELPRLFTLSQLPRDTVEEDTAVTHTSGGDEEEALVQTTRLGHPEGEITVRATRSDGAAERFESLRRGGQEVAVRGQPAYVREGQRLVWLVEGDPATLVEVDGPATIGTDELLTIANGLEMTR